MKNPYVRLAVRLSVVLFVIILISKLRAGDDRVLAQAGAEAIVTAMHHEGEHYDALKEIPDGNASDKAPVSEEIERLASNDDVNNQTHDSATDVNTADNPAADDASDDKDIYGDDVNIPDGQQETDNPDTDEPASNSTDESPVTDGETEEPEGPDPNDPALYVGLNELEAAELHAKLDPAYKSSSAYINALLVTHPDHYNEAIVLEAHSMPLESNDARYEFLTGQGYKAYTTKDMPDGYQSESKAAANCVTFDVPVWKMNSSGKRYSTVWSITINKKLAASVRCIFSDIYQLDIQFPFNYLKGFMYRKVGGSGLMSSPLMSIHAFGSAIDINYWDDDNDYYLGRGNDLRNKSNPYCIPDEVIDIFAGYGWFWGGNFDICADTMHFQYLGLEFLQYESDEPFPILYRGAEDMNSTYINNLAKRLVRLGYLEEETSKFTRKLDTALKAFQEDYGLEPDGIADYETWVPLINETHDMSYAF